MVARAAALSVPRGGACEQGMTLLEVVVGLAILVVATLGFVAAIVGSLKASALLRQHTVALAAAEQRLETLAVLPAAELAAQDGERFAISGLDPLAGETTVGLVTVSTDAAPLLGVAVTLRWRGPHGDEVVRLDTVVLPR